MKGENHMQCNHDASQLCVSKVPFFNHLAYEEMVKIADISMHRNYYKGETIYEAWDPLNYLYIVHTGSVKIYQLFESGKEQVLRILQAGEFFGELALFAEKTMENYVEALEETNICMIHREQMQQLMTEYPMIAIKILEQFSERMDAADKLIGELSAKDVEARIASYVLELAGKQETKTITLPMTKKDLASFLGTSQETLSRRLSNFQKQGMITQEGHRKIIIEQYDRLEEIAEAVL